MQALNVLIVSTKESQYIQHILASKYLNKLYVTSENEVSNTIRIKFNTFKELAQKCKSLQIDIVLVEEEKWILEGISNVMRQHFINCFAVTSEWTELKLSHNFARTMLQKYLIDVPRKINLPIDFPVLVKADGILKKANSMQEVIEIKESIFHNSPEISKTVYLEQMINGKKQEVISLFDGKHLLTFPKKEIDLNLLTEYSKRLENLLLSEKANFIGFVNSYIIQSDNILYNVGFNFKFTIPDFEMLNTSLPNDFLYICMSAIYQKLDEISFNTNI